MNRKALAREFLLFLGSAVFIGISILIWSLVDNQPPEKNKDSVQNIGLRMEVYQNMTDLQLQEEFVEIIDIAYPDNFIRLLRDPKISKQFYSKAKSLELYKWNNNYFSLEELKEAYGDSLENKIEKYQFKKTNVITDLSYPAFRTEIEKDTIYSQNPEIKVYSSKALIPQMTRSGIIWLITIILVIAYPFRWLIYLTKWSIKELRTNANNGYK